jgi:hypothetical protein
MSHCKQQRKKKTMHFTISMHSRRRYYLIGLLMLCIALLGMTFLTNGGKAHAAASSSYDQPTWWAKYQALLNGNYGSAATSKSLSVGTNVDMSNEDGPQSETSISVNPKSPNMLVGGSNVVRWRPNLAAGHLFQLQ